VGGYTIDFDTKIGSGRFSNVYAAVSPEGEGVAVKAFKPEWVEDSHIEIKNLIALKTHLAGTPDLRVITYTTVLTDDSRSPLVVMPRLGCDLLSMLDLRYGLRDAGASETTMGLPRWLCAKIATDVLQGLYQMHSVGLVHSDIKPDNVMCTRNFDTGAELLAAPTDSYYFVLVDVGSAFLSVDAHGTNHGTDMYRAPELVTQQPVIGYPLDIASAGALIFEMRCRDPLYDLHEGDDESSDGSDVDTRSSSSSDSLRDVQADMATARLMQATFGRFPQSMVRRSASSNYIFNSRGGILYAPAPPPHPTLQERLMSETYCMQLDEAEEFSDFLYHMCALSAGRRLTPEALLEHSWLVCEKPCGSKVPPE